MFFEMRFDLGTLDSGEGSLPFGLLGLNRHMTLKPSDLCESECDFET